MCSTSICVVLASFAYVRLKRWTINPHVEGGCRKRTGFDGSPRAKVYTAFRRCFSWMLPEDPYQLEIQLHRFNKLLAEVMRGAVTRNSFQRWEIEILLDLEHCQVERRRRLEILRQYQRAVAKQMERGPGPPMKLSEFLAQRALRHEAKAPPSAGVDLRLGDHSEI